MSSQSSCEETARTYKWWTLRVPKVPNRIWIKRNASWRSSLTFYTHIKSLTFVKRLNNCESSLIHTTHNSHELANRSKANVLCELCGGRSGLRVKNICVEEPALVIANTLYSMHTSQKFITFIDYVGVSVIIACIKSNQITLARTHTWNKYVSKVHNIYRFYLCLSL